MAISLKDFWKAAIDSRLLSVEECQSLHAAFARVRGAEQGNAATLAEWLVTSNVLSRYQAHVLLAGKTRPFVFDEYKVFDKHDAGRFKGLYRAVHLPTGQTVSLYILATSLAEDPRRLAAVTQQALAAAAVREPHVARVFEYLERKPARLIVIEDFATSTPGGGPAGVTLADYLAAQPLAPADGCRLVRDVALALAALHKTGIAHGDVRPQNIWLTAEGGVKLLAFPVSRDPAEPATYHYAGGEPSPRAAAQADFLAPELASGRRAPDARSDIYSLGCLAYLLLVHQPPFAGGDVADKLRRHASEPAVPLENFGMPPALAQLVAHMMAKNPPVRLESAAAAGEQLVAFATADPTAGRPLGAVQQAFEQCVAQRAATMPRNLPVEAAGNGALAAGGLPQGRGTASGMAGNAPAYPAPHVGPAMEPLDHGPAVALAEAPLSPHLAAAHDLSMLGPAAKRPRRKRQPMNPLVIAASILAVCGLGGIILGLATQSSAPEQQPQPTELASATSTPEPKPRANPGKKSPRKDEIEAEENPREGFEDDPPSATKTPDKNSPEPTPPKKKPKAPKKPAVQAIDDDGATLWISPTSGEPISLRYLPSGGQVFLALRPAEIIANPEGARMVEALGPAGALAKQQIQALTGIDPTKIQQMVIGFYLKESGVPDAALVARLDTPAAEEELLAAWNNPAPAEQGDKKYFKNDRMAYYLPASEQGRVIAIMPASEAADTLAADEPRLSKDMDKLLSETDAQRMFTVMAAPTLLFRDGKALFAGELDRLQEPLNRFIGPGIAAAMLSVHVDRDLFVELSVVGDTTDEPMQLAARYKAELEKLPGQLDDYLNSFDQHLYSKRILAKFPRMIETLADYARPGEEHRQAVLRAYLPSYAAHNLVLGTELALFERPGGVAAGTKGPVASKASGAAEALKQKISLSFSRDTLEKCMEMLGKEIDTEVVILGGDLQLDGITKNQSFGLDERDKPADEILRIVLGKANPDGKLVYVIKPKDGGKEAIFITTRAAVEKRGDKLPPELVQNPAKGK